MTNKTGEQPNNWRPINLRGSNILDGRNRYRACMELCVEPRTEQLADGADALQFVIDSNITRRHLDDSQRASLAAKSRIWDMEANGMIKLRNHILITLKG